MSLPYPSLRQGLIAAWCPSLGAGSLLPDRSGFAAHGTVGAGASFSARNTGVALYSTTANYALSAPKATFAGNAAVTVSYWFMVGVDTDAGGVTQGVSEGSRLFWGVGGGSNPNGLVYVGGRYPAGDAYGFGNVSFLANKPRHFAGLIDTRQATAATCRRAWVDGVEVTLSHVGGVSPAFPAFASGILIGQRFSGSTIYGTTTTGHDDIRIYNRALTLAEIRLLASQRGIGLRSSAPLYDDDADLQSYPLADPPSRLFANVSGTWTPGAARARGATDWDNAAPSANVSGVWQ